MNRSAQTSEEHEPVMLGIALAALQVAVFFAFIGYCAFAAPTAPWEMGQIPMQFLLGLLVIGCGAVLTVVYVLVSNRQGQSHD